MGRGMNRPVEKGSEDESMEENSGEDGEVKPNMPSAARGQRGIRSRPSVPRGIRGARGRGGTNRPVMEKDSKMSDDDSMGEGSKDDSMGENSDEDGEVKPPSAVRGRGVGVRGRSPGRGVRGRGRGRGRGGTVEKVNKKSRGSEDELNPYSSDNDSMEENSELDEPKPKVSSSPGRGRGRGNIFEIYHSELLNRCTIAANLGENSSWLT